MMKKSDLKGFTAEGNWLKKRFDYAADVRYCPVCLKKHEKYFGGFARCYTCFMAQRILPIPLSELNNDER